MWITGTASDRRDKGFANRLRRSSGRFDKGNGGVSEEERVSDHPSGLDSLRQDLLSSGEPATGSGLVVHEKCVPAQEDLHQGPGGHRTVAEGVWR